MATAKPPFDPRLPEFHANPYPFYHALLEKDPVHQSPMAFWLLTRYDNVVTSLRDPRFGRDGFAPLLAATYGPENVDGNLPCSMPMRYGSQAQQRRLAKSSKSITIIFPFPRSRRLDLSRLRR